MENEEQIEDSKGQYITRAEFEKAIIELKKEKKSHD